MVVKVFAVHHKQHFVDIVQSCCQLCGLEAGEGLARTSGVPYIATAFYFTIGAAVVGNLYALENTLGSHNLIRSHNEQQFLGGEDAILGQDIEQRTFGKESACEVHQVENGVVLCICPIGSKLE